MILTKPLACGALCILLAHAATSQKQAADYVNPFIGTQNMGHVYPGATVPFGMVQLSPETDTIMYSTGSGYNKEVYRYCAGYQYDDPTITGFSHTHFSGTGHSDLGDFLVMPTTGKVRLNPGVASRPGSGYRSRFSHSTETATPGYYSVRLDDYGVKAELTATCRVGFHRYTYPATDSANLILDLMAGIYNYDGKVIWSSVRVENDTLITGYRQTRGWARDRLVYFAASFSKPVTAYGYKDAEKIEYRDFYRKFNVSENFPEMAGRKVRAWFRFDTRDGKPLLVKFALSSVSPEGALENLRQEIPGWNFEQVRADAHTLWQKELGKVEIEASEREKTIFYTALYHAFLSPTVYMDVDGQYRGLDHNIHKAEQFTNYTTFSLWDTYRALHPLFTILQQQRTSDMINSLLAHYDQSVHHILPVWSHHANENWCMIGYHATPVIADAYLKGIRGFDAAKALEACNHSATYAPYDGIGYYMKFGYVPSDLNSNSASKTLEYAYDDYAIARFAEAIGNDTMAKSFRKRSGYFSNIWDPSIRFMRPKRADGSWQSPFDPLSTEGQGFIEGNAWNYSLYVPQDIPKLISFYGGNKKFTAHLDSLFSMKLPEEYFAQSEDLSAAGMIGNYVHGNEPSHHVPYLYVFAGYPSKTQEKIHEIVTTMYGDTPHGLCGNDDCGQMSAWYVFSALGFYPVCPGSNEYVLGTPAVSKATLHLENGKTFVVSAPAQSESNFYVKKVLLNNRPLGSFILRHEELMQGGELLFELSNRP